jgi:hypothetical protein
MDRTVPKPAAMLLDFIGSKKARKATTPSLLTAWTGCPSPGLHDHKGDP